MSPASDIGTLGYSHGLGIQPNTGVSKTHIITMTTIAIMYKTNRPRHTETQRRQNNSKLFDLKLANYKICFDYCNCIVILAIKYSFSAKSARQYSVKPTPCALLSFTYVLGRPCIFHTLVKSLPKTS